MPGDYSCFLCSKSMTYAGKIKHLFSKTHLPQIHAGIQKRREALELWISLYDQGKKSALDLLPPISLTAKAGSSYLVCIPCKHIGPVIKGHECNQMKENVEYYKKVLKQPVIKATTASIEIQTDGVPGVSAAYLGVPSDPKQIERLKKEIELLKKDNDLLNDKCEKADLFCNALYYSINYVREQDSEMYESIMGNLEEDYEGVISHIKN